MDRDGQTELSYARGFFQAYLSPDDDDIDSDHQARSLIGSMASEIEALRALTAKLEARAMADRPDLEGNAQMKERSRCTRIVARAILDAHSHLGLSEDTRDGVRMAAEAIIEAIESGKDPRDASAGGAS